MEPTQPITKSDLQQAVDDLKKQMRKTHMSLKIWMIVLSLGLYAAVLLA